MYGKRRHETNDFVCSKCNTIFGNQHDSDRCCFTEEEWVRENE